MRRIDREARDPFAVLEDRRHYFVQCYAEEGRFCVEWRENYDSNDWDDFAHWRASVPERTETPGRKSVSRRGHADPNTIPFADTVLIFQAFLQGDPKAARYRWRDIKPLLEQGKTRRQELKQAKPPRRKAASHD